MHISRLLPGTSQAPGTSNISVHMYTFVFLAGTNCIAQQSTRDVSQHVPVMCSHQTAKQDLTERAPHTSTRMACPFLQHISVTCKQAALVLGRAELLCLSKCNQLDANSTKRHDKAFFGQILETLLQMKVQMPESKTSSACDAQPQALSRATSCIQIDCCLRHVRLDYQDLMNVPGMHWSSVAGGNVEACIEAHGHSWHRGLLLVSGCSAPGFRIL